MSDNESTTLLPAPSADATSVTEPPASSVPSDAEVIASLTDQLDHARRELVASQKALVSVTDQIDRLSTDRAVARDQLEIERGSVARHLRELIAAEQLLASMEWAGPVVVTPDHRSTPTCPCCKKFDQHAAGCALAKVIDVG